MNQRGLSIVVLLLIGMLTAGDVWARGGGRGGGGGGRGGGGRGGGGAARSAAARSPSMSRSSFSRPSGGYSGGRPSGGARPSGGYSGARPSGGGGRASLGSLPTPNRPGSGISTRPSGGSTRPGSGSRQNLAGGTGGRPGASTRPTPGGRPTQGQLNDFLDLGGSGSRPSSGRPSTFPGAAAGAIAGNAAYDFLRDNPGRFERPTTLPATRPGGDINRPGSGDLAGGDRPNRPGGGDTGNRPDRPSRPGGGEDGGRPGRPGGDDRPGRPGDRPNRPGNGDHRPDKKPDWDRWQDWRHDQWSNTNRYWHNNWNHYDRWFGGDWCQHHPYWHWRPGFNYWAWATWPAVVNWFPWGWSQPVYYNYGNNVYYDDGTVYYGDTAVATADEYADQAAVIAANVPAEPPPADSWMPLGVFAVMPDGDAEGADPTLFLQLTVSKTGVIAGTLQNTTSGKTTNVEGMVDKQSQRAAWTAVGETRPIMETGIGNLTQDTAPALVHFADGTTQQWLLVRMDAPPADAAGSTSGAKSGSSAKPATPPQ